MKLKNPMWRCDMIHRFRTYLTSHLTRALRYEKVVPEPRIIYDLYLAVKDSAHLDRAFLLSASTSGYQVCSNLLTPLACCARAISESACMNRIVSNALDPRSLVTHAETLIIC